MAVLEMVMRRRLKQFRALGYKVAQMNRDLMTYAPKQFDSDVPVVVQPYGLVGPVFPFMWAARVAGVAVVWDGTGATLIGRECNLYLLRYHYPLDVCREADLLHTVAVCERALWADGMGGLHGDEWLARYAQWDARRVALNSVQHKVVEVYPQLRRWRMGSGEYPDAELVLRPHHGGLRLGGCVWMAEAYTTHAGRQFLDL